MKSCTLIILLLFAVPPLVSQEGRTIEELCQLIIENRDDLDSEWLEGHLESLLANPVDLNTSSETELRESQLFTAFQAYGIVKYREKYGALLSVYELASIPGFDKNFLIKIESLLTTETREQAFTPKRNKLQLLLNAYIKSPLTEAYIQTDSIKAKYAGSFMKDQVRIKYQLPEKINLGLAFEKDPGETFITANKPEHLTAFLEYRPGGFIDHLILGNFQVNQGMGIVQGMGMSSGQPGSGPGSMCLSYARPYAGCMEYDYYRGLYIKAKNNSWNLSSYLSFLPVDLSLFRTDAEKSLFERVRETGLHRTESEIAGVSLARQISAMLSFGYDARRWNAGISMNRSVLRLSKSGRDSVPLMDTIPSAKTNFSIYGLYFTDRMEVFGELALDQTGRLAFNMGSRILISPAITISLSKRRYDAGFLSQQSTAYSAGSNTGNESACSIAAIIIPAKYASIHAWSDIYKTIEIPSGFVANQFRIRYSCSLTFSPTSDLSVEGRLQLKNAETGERNPMRPEAYPQTLRSYRVHADYRLSESLNTSLRVEITRTYYHTGKLFYQELRFSKERISVKYRYLVFSVPDYANRIYCYEPGVLYSYRFPSFNGKGCRNLLVISADLYTGLKFRACLGHTTYYHTRQTGSGNDVRKGNRNLDLELQLQLVL